MSAHPAPRAMRSIRAETAGSSGLALGPNQRGKAGGEVEASTPVMANGPPAHPTKGPPGEPILLDAGSIVPRMCRSRDARERARDALAAILRWLEGLLGRRLEGGIDRAAAWPPYDGGSGRADRSAARARLAAARRLP